jgi:hypothetical protein
MLARIHLTTSAAAFHLTRALSDAECVVVRRGKTTVDVIEASADDGLDAHQARLELLFFVKAWAADHPGVAATFAV